MGYFVKDEDFQTGEVTRQGPFVTEQEARMILGNAVEGAYDSNPHLAGVDVRQEVEDAVRATHILQYVGVLSPQPLPTILSPVAD